jgi:hypothetical protein
MKSIFATAISAIVVASILTVTPACAQNAQSWVARAGLDTNLCTISAPCATLVHAISLTMAGGQVNIADAGEYQNSGTLIINKDIAIVNDGVGDAVVSKAGTGIIASVSAASVTLRGLVIDGRGTGQYGLAVEPFLESTLIIEKCVFRNNASSGLGSGLIFIPHSAGKLVVTDSSFLSNGTPTTGAGIQIRPSGSGSAEVVLERATVAGNTFGIAADGSSSTGGINMTIAASVVSSNTKDGIVATTSAGGAPIGLMIKNTRSVNNAGFGVRSIGSGVTTRLSASTVTGNGIGVTATSGGAILTFGNNEIAGNGSNGSFTGTATLQ